MKKIFVIFVGLLVSIGCFAYTTQEYVDNYEGSFYYSEIDYYFHLFTDCSDFNKKQKVFESKKIEDISILVPCKSCEQRFINSKVIGKLDNINIPAKIFFAADSIEMLSNKNILVIEGGLFEYYFEDINSLPFEEIASITIDDETYRYVYYDCVCEKTNPNDKYKLDYSFKTLERYTNNVKINTEEFEYSPNGNISYGKRIWLEKPGRVDETFYDDNGNEKIYKEYQNGYEKVCKEYQNGKLVKDIKYSRVNGNIIRQVEKTDEGTYIYDYIPYLSTSSSYTEKITRPNGIIEITEEIFDSNLGVFVKEECTVINPKTGCILMHYLWEERNNTWYLKNLIESFNDENKTWGRTYFDGKVFVPQTEIGNDWVEIKEFDDFVIVYDETGNELKRYFEKN